MNLKVLRRASDEAIQWKQWEKPRGNEVAPQRYSVVSFVLQKSLRLTLMVSLFFSGKKYRRVCFKGRTFSVLARLLSYLSAWDIFTGQPGAAATLCLPWLENRRYPISLASRGEMLSFLVSWAVESDNVWALSGFIKSPHFEGRPLNRAARAFSGRSAVHLVYLSGFQRLFCCLLHLSGFLMLWSAVSVEVYLLSPPLQRDIAYLL